MMMHQQAATGTTSQHHSFSIAHLLTLPFCIWTQHPFTQEPPRLHLHPVPSTPSTREGVSRWWCRWTYHLRQVDTNLSIYQMSSSMYLSSPLLSNSFIETCPTTSPCVHVGATPCVHFLDHWRVIRVSQGHDWQFQCRRLRTHQFRLVQICDWRYVGLTGRYHLELHVSLCTI